MPPISPSNVRVVDPILSTHARGYRHAARVAHLLFPSVPVFVGGGKVLTFGKESFLEYASARAPGINTKRINFGYAGADFALVGHSLEAPVPREFQRDASQVPGIDLGKMAVNVVLNAMQLGAEIEAAGIAVNAANYADGNKTTLAGATKWSHAEGKPLTDIDNAKNAIRAKTGMDANTLILSADGWTATKNNVQVVGRIYKDQTSANVGPITLEQFKKVVEIENVAVGKAVKATDAGVFSDVWGNNAILAYVPPQAEVDVPVPSYGYTYTMSGHPMVEVPYWDNSAKSWIYGVTYERAVVLTGMDAGYLFKNPL